MPSVINFGNLAGKGLFFNDAKIDTGTVKFGGASAYFNGDLKSYIKSSQALSLAAQSWCVEMWVNLSASQSNADVRIAQVSTDLPNELGPGHLSIKAGGGLSVFAFDYSESSNLISTSENIIGAGWKHLALSRDGSTWRLFLDGVEIGTATWAGSITGTNCWLFGGNSYSQTGMTGWLDDVRFTLGVPRYVSAFTPPLTQAVTSVGQARYFRLETTANGGPTYVSVSEMYLRYAGVDLNTTGKTYSASSFLSTNYQPQYAFDMQVEGFYWATFASSTQTLTVDMGAQISVDQIDLIIKSLISPSESPTAYKLLCSVDNINWITLFTKSDFTAALSPGSRRTHAVTIPGSTADDPFFNNVAILYLFNEYKDFPLIPRDVTRFGHSNFAPAAQLSYFKRDVERQSPIRYQISGNGRIYGTVKIKGIPNLPVSRRVRLFREIDGLCLAETWSNAATGEYEFLGFDPAYRYTVLTYDYQQNFRAVVADNLTPEAFI